MLPESEWGEVVAAWNAMHSPAMKAELEWVEECLLAFSRWQSAIAELRTIDAFEHFNRHLEFCRRVPDPLLLLLTDEDFDDQ